MNQTQSAFVRMLLIGGIAFVACSNKSEEEPDKSGDVPAGGQASEETGDGGGAAGAEGDDASSEGGALHAGGRGAGDDGSPGGTASTEGGGPGEDGGPADGGGGERPSEDGGGFAIVEPSEDCEGDSSNGPEPVSRNPHLEMDPTSGQVCDDTFEPNDAPGSACRLRLGTRVQTQLSPPGDPTDNFVFHAESGLTYSVMISTVGCQGQSSLDAFTVGASALGETGETTLPVGTVYVGKNTAFEVTSNITSDVLLTLSNKASCQYSLSVVQSTEQGLSHADDHEPNDTRSTGATIELGELISSELAGPSDVIDHFLFSAQAGITYSLHVSAERCAGRSSLDGMKVSGWSKRGTVDNLRSFADFGKALDVEFTSATTGLQVLSFETDQSCEYQFYVVPSSHCGLQHDFGSLEPNNTPSTATHIRVGETIHSEIRLPQDSVDHYAFPVEPLTPYTLSISASNCVGSTSIASLTASLYSGRTTSLPNNSREVFFGAARTNVPFVTGSSSEELLVISRSSSCTYEFAVAKQ